MNPKNIDDLPISNSRLLSIKHLDRSLIENKDGYPVLADVNIEHLRTGDRVRMSSGSDGVINSIELGIVRISWADFGDDAHYHSSCYHIFYLEKT